MRVCNNPVRIKNIGWSKFVKNHPNGNLFQTPEMFDVYEKTKNYEPVVIGITNDNEIVGLLLAVIQAEHSGFLGIFSSRLIVDGGPLIKNDNLEVLEIILNELDLLTKRKVIYTIYRNYWVWDDKFNHIVINEGYNYIEHLDIIINLNKEPEVIKKKFKRNLRRNITKSINKGVELVDIIDIDDFKSCLKLIGKTYNRVKLPLPDYSLFINAFELLAPLSFIKVFAAKFGDKLIGVRIEIFYNNYIFDWYAGHDEDDNNKYPNDFLISEILTWGSRNKMDYFDFGGAGRKGVPYSVRDYKMKFGGELVEFGRYEKINKPLLMKVAKMGLSVMKRIKL